MKIIEKLEGKRLEQFLQEVEGEALYILALVRDLRVEISRCKEGETSDMDVIQIATDLESKTEHLCEICSDMPRKLGYDVGVSGISIIGADSE